MGEAEPRDVAALRDSVARGQRWQYLYFWGHTPSSPSGVGKECLSQWYPAGFTVDGVRYASAEHFMMASKARLFGDGETETAILAAPHPKDAKRLGRTIHDFDEATWTERRRAVVVAGNMAKFGTHTALRHFLLGTNDRVLVEASPSDPIWGIGLAYDDPRAADPHLWKGQNLLGFVLMEVRARLRDENDAVR